MKSTGAWSPNELQWLDLKKGTRTVVPVITTRVTFSFEILMLILSTGKPELHPNKSHTADTSAVDVFQFPAACENEDWEKEIQEEAPFMACKWLSHWGLNLFQET